MPRLILIRHGESEWNRDRRFTGWADVGLTGAGRKTMVDAGALLRKSGFDVDFAFSSLLSRCVMSLWALLEGMGRVWVPCALDWRLNERHYGALTGLSREQAVATFGAAAVQGWRRSFSVAPPQGVGDGDGHALVDERYRHLLPSEIPRGESLAQVVDRVQPLWSHAIRDALQSRQCVVIMGHGNSLRALMKLIEDIPAPDISTLEVPNAAAKLDEFDRALLLTRTVNIGDTCAPQEHIL
jgi:2,3-bisphosphoglycerate-dependent phosphoglycerate mutase